MPHGMMTRSGRQSTKKRRLERKWRSTGLEVDHQLYKEHCCIYLSLISTAKTSYHITKLSNCDHHTLFSHVDKLVNGKKVQILPSSINKDKLPQAFADYFKYKTDNLRSLATTTYDSLLVQLPTHQCSYQLTAFTSVDTEGVKSILSNSPTKSCCLDPLPTVILKSCIDSLLPTITSIVNISLTNGQIPVALKVACVAPCIKKPSLDPNVLNHYRPISNLPFLSKVLERAVALQLHSYLTSNDLYPRLQSAYRKNHSTETALLRVQNDLLRAIDNGSEALLILLDFSAAFDTIDHDICLHRLQNRFGISGIALSWIASFFKDPYPVY